MKLLGLLIFISLEMLFRIGVRIEAYVTITLAPNRCFHRLSFGGFRHLLNSKKETAGRSWSSISQLTISSEANDKVKLLKSLQQKKKRDAQDLLLLEGHRQIIDAINDGFLPKTLFYSEKCFDAPLGQALRESLNKCPESAIFSATDAVIQSVSDTVTAQGVVGAFPKPQKLVCLPKTSSHLVVLLDRPADPGNVGTIIRAAYGLGIDAIVIVDGCDPWSPKVLRSAMGACLKIPILESRWSEVPALLSGVCGSIDDSGDVKIRNSSSNSNDATELQVLLADADASAIPYYEANYKVPTVIVIGSEADGIGKDALALPNSKKIIIPMARPLESFNAAVACSIILGEATRQRQGLKERT
jgi:TrmH family RNA methyltransferase